MRELPANIAEKLPAAATVFAELGFDQARMEDVAAGCGIPKPTLYYHFGGKEEILAWLLERLPTATCRAKSAPSSTTMSPHTPGSPRYSPPTSRCSRTTLDVARVLLTELGRITRIRSWRTRSGRRSTNRCASSSMKATRRNTSQPRP